MKKEVKIGLTIIAGVASLYIALTWVKSMHLFAANRSTYQIRFENVTGLKEGDPVNVYGYPSGNVERIRIDREGALVTINLNAKITLKADAGAEIRVKELMGGKMIEVFPGKNGATLAGGQLIHGSSSLDFTTAFAKSGDFMDRFSGKMADSLWADLTALVQTFSKIASTFENFDGKGVMEDFQNSASNLNKMLAEIQQRRLLENIDQSLKKVNALAEKAEGSLNTISSLSGSIEKKTLPNADSLMRKVSAMLSESEGMISDVSDLLKQLSDKNGLAGQMLYDPAFADLITGTLENLDLTLDQIRTKKIYVGLRLGKNAKNAAEGSGETKSDSVSKK